MPYHRVPRSELAEFVQTVEADGHEIGPMVADGDHVIVITRWVDDRMSVRRTVAEGRL